MCTPHAFTPSAARMDQIRRGTSPRPPGGISRRALLRAGGLGALAALAGTAAVGRGPLDGLLGREALAQVLTDAGICVPAEQISIQLFTMAETFAEDFEGTVAALAAIGYRIVEHAGTDAAPDGSAESFRATFDANGIAITSGHRSVPFPYDEAEWQATLEECAVLGCTRINEPLPAFLLPDLVIASGGGAVGTTTSVQYAQFADALNQAGAAAQAMGIAVGYHNHNPEFLLLPDNPTMKGYDVLLAETDPALVDFEMDVYWVTAGGEDPVTRLQMHEGRFGQLHIKDMAEDGSITFPGTGIIDFAAIVAEGARQGIVEYIVEQDNADAEGVRAAELGYQLLSAGCAVPAPTAPEVVRVAGSGRAETAAALSALRVEPGVVVAYVAGGSGFADALAAGPAAAAEGGPLLLVDADAVPAATRAELERLGAGRIVVVGGPAAVSDAVLAELEELTAGGVERRAGDDRYATAAAVAAAVFPGGVDRAVVATGEDFPDALAGGTAAAGGPVLLTRPDALPEATRAELERLAPAAITVVGGLAAVSDAVVAELQAIAPTTRVAGATRYDTAAAAAEVVTATGGTVLVATGEAFPDALAATGVAAAAGEPVLLVQPDALPDATRAALVRLAPTAVLVLGGTAAVGDAVLDDIRQALSARP
jgi:putative cell wall-binding protein/sugar phosphate isomerase/epimerase